MTALLFLAFLAASAPSAGDAPTVGPVAKVTFVAPDEKDLDKKICKSEPVIGSNIRGKKVCTTKREILARQQAARDEADRLRTSVNAASGN